MVASCSSCNLSHNAWKVGITFHRFPKKPEVRSAWIKFLNRSEESVQKLAFLCSPTFFKNQIWTNLLSKKELLPNHKKPPVNQILQFLLMVCPLLCKQNAFYPVPVLALWIQAMNTSFHPKEQHQPGHSQL
ncbi:hypothetical protein NQ317_002295 [Molorchus minor]|uniref:THAP-type domain-containing protein n=1 Tax=Molorchus minor TaxID=1323400 RepID=A0ABQ9ITG9_9CUCU|nr:hypothetical protein NQ317_002295 [Molorchus minor]